MSDAKPIHVPGKHWISLRGYCIMCGVTQPKSPECKTATVGALLGMELAERKLRRESANYIKNPPAKRKRVEI